MSQDPPDKKDEFVKRERAIALEYTDPDDIPRIVATGAGEIAKKIIELAEKNNVPVSQDESLADMLSKLQVGSAVSSESYKLVSEVLSFLYHTDRLWRDNHPHLRDIMGQPLEEDLKESDDAEEE